MSKVRKLSPNGITDGVIWEQLLLFFFPIVLGTFFQQLYNTADAIIVGKFVGKEALAAVGGTTGTLINLLVGFFVGLSSGASVIISQFYGARKADDVSRAVHTTMALAVTSGALLTVTGILFSEKVLWMMGTPAEVMEYAVTYIRIYFLGMIPSLIYNIGSGILRAVGDSRRPLFFLIAATMTNIVLDIVLVLGLNMGVAGAAVATVIGQFCGCALALYFNLKKNHDIRLHFKGFRPHWKIIGQIYAIGLPSVVMVAIGSVMTFCMNKILIAYHSAKETAATAFGIYFKLNSFIFMPIFGLNNGVVSIIAYNYGAQHRRRMTETIKRSTIYASCIMLLGMSIFLSIPGTLLKIFDATDTLLAVGVPALRIISLSFCMAGASIALTSAFQALGKSLYSMIISIIRQLVFLVPLAYILARYGAGIGNNDLVWWSYPIAEIAALTVSLLFFRHMYKTLIAKLPDHGPAISE